MKNNQEKENKKDENEKENKREERNYKIVIEMSCEILATVCTIVSTVFISKGTLDISKAQLDSSNRQNQISEAEQGTAVDIFLEYPTDESGLAKLVIHNSGAAAVSYNIDTISYFDIRCDENFQGTSYPVRVYVTGAVQELNASEFKYNENELGAFSVYTDKISNHHCMAMLCTLIRIETENVLGKTEYSYFLEEGTVEYETDQIVIGEPLNIDAYMTDRPSVRRLEQEKGDEIYNEYMEMNEYPYGVILPDSPRFSIEKLKPETVFRYALMKIREYDLYVYDDETGGIRYYGEYEPDISTYWEEQH